MASKEHVDVLAHLMDIGALFTKLDPSAPPYVGMRTAMDSLFNNEPPPNVRFQKAALPGMKAEWVVSERCDYKKRLLFLHGGGYIAGGITSHRNLAAWTAEHSGCAVLLIDYRLAPEHPFPAAVDDAVIAYRWMTQNGAEGPGAARRRFVAGDSAGGGLALALLLALRGEAIDACDGCVTYSAWTDVSNSSPSIITNGNPSLGSTKEVADYFTLLYMNGDDPRQSLASPVYGNLKGLPPLLMQVSDAEMIFDDSVRFAERARDAGVNVQLDVWQGLVHVWHGFAPRLPEAMQALARAGQFLRSL